MPQSFEELVEESRKLIEQSRVLRGAAKEATSDARCANDRAKTLQDSLIERNKYKPR